MIISIEPMGNLGNRMLQYMAAIPIGSLLDKNTVYNCHLPEWGLQFNQDLHNKIKSSISETITIRDSEVTTTIDAANIIIKSQKKNVILEGFFLRTELYFDRNFYQGIFPDTHGTRHLDQHFSDNDLVINVRSGELRGGIGWYPLMPIEFYRQLVSSTGLRPIFVGQIDESLYTDELKRNFPDAQMINSVSPVDDMNLLRQAKNIVISVSTFSWLAGWLSNAKKIFYPMLGFLHPTCLKRGAHGLGGVDMLPIDDPRYIYYLFPIIIGEEESIYLDRIKKVHPIAKWISSDRARDIKFNSKKNGHTLTEDQDFDENWYFRTYIDAAWEVSEGIYSDAISHYKQNKELNKYFVSSFGVDLNKKQINAGSAPILIELSKNEIQETKRMDDVMNVVYDQERPDLGGNLRYGDINTWCGDLWKLLVEVFAIRSMLDVGCGEGHAVAFFNKLGVYGVGIDGLRKNINRSVFPIVLHDLLQAPFTFPVDFVWSSEVAEHIEEAHVNNYIDTLANGKVVAMTHALPGQGGHHHVNCQPSEYWIEKMSEKGYFLAPDTNFFREIALKTGGGKYFYKSGLVFLKA
jgi:SAM-dependent methyltransferase